MSLIATAVKHLLAAGVTGDALVAAIAELEAELRAEPKPRSKGAIRTANYRERKASRASQNVTCDASDDGDAAGPSPASPNDNNLTPSTHTPEKPNPVRAKAGHRMPADWRPQPLTGETGKATANWPPGALDRELERFRDWALSATGPHSKKSDWQAAWRNWIRKAEDEGRYRNGNRSITNGVGRDRGTSGFGSTIDGLGDFVADFAARH